MLTTFSINRQYTVYHAPSIPCLPFLMLMDLVIVDSYVFSIYMTHWNSCPTWAAEWFIIRMNSFISLPSAAIWEFSQFEQLNGFSSVYTLSCVFKCCDWLNFFSHFKQLNGFSPVWILSWVFKLCKRLKQALKFDIVKKTQGVKNSKLKEKT